MNKAFQLFYSVVFAQVADLNIRSERLAELYAEANAVERGQTGGKQLSLDAEIIVAEHFFCYVKDFLLHFGLRLGELGNRRAQLRQPLGVGLAVGGHGHFVHLQERRRNHVVREVLFQLVAQFINIDLSVGGKIGAKVVLSAQRTDDDRRLFDVRLGGDKLLDLAQLNAQTAQLDLAVESAEYIDVSVFVKFCVVAGAVHSLTLVLNKRLGGLFGQVAVALGNAHAADVQLADNAVGRKVAEPVNNVFAVVEQGSADCDIIGVAKIGCVARNRDLGGAVGVDYPDVF